MDFGNRMVRWVISWLSVGVLGCGLRHGYSSVQMAAQSCNVRCLAQLLFGWFGVAVCEFDQACDFIGQPEQSRNCDESAHADKVCLWLVNHIWFVKSASEQYLMANTSDY